MQARYYDPVIGRFYSNDPVGFTGDITTFNRYSYVGNNPYKYTDPDGKFRRLAFRFLKEPVRTAKKSFRNFKKFLQRNGVIAPTPQPVRNDGDLPISDGNNNPYDGPVDEPVIVVDGDGNAIPIEEGEQITGSQDGNYEQVRDKDGQPTGIRKDKGGHRGQSDPKARGPHGHRPGVTDSDGNPHLPLKPPRKDKE